MRSILLDIIPRRFRRRSYLVSGTIFLRALLNFAGLALLIPVLLLILDSESMHTNPWLERLYQAGGFESDRAFALTVCGCIVALIAFKNLLNLFLLRYERRYIYDLYRCMSRRLYIEYHDRGLGFIKNTNSALLSRNVNFVCLAFVTGILVPLASITSESMLLALLFTALLFYNPTVAGLVLLVFIPTVWFYYSAVRKRLHRYGVQENEAQREKARTVVETFRGYADLEINDAFPSMLRRFDRAMDKIVTIQSRNMTVNALPSIFMEVGLAIGMALFVAVSLGTPGDEARVLFGVFAVAGLRLMPSVRNMMSGWSALKYNRYTIDILRDIDLNDEKPEPSAAQPPQPFEREIAVRDLSFRFDDERGGKEVLHGLTLTIRKGEHVGIRGASGAGKTTLFNLLLGFYTPTGGEITIDGEPLLIEILPLKRKDLAKAARLAPNQCQIPGDKRRKHLRVPRLKRLYKRFIRLLLISDLTDLLHGYAPNDYCVLIILQTVTEVKKINYIIHKICSGSFSIYRKTTNSPVYCQNPTFDI